MGIKTKLTPSIKSICKAEDVFSTLSLGSFSLKPSHIKPTRLHPTLNNPAQTASISPVTQLPPATNLDGGVSSSAGQNGDITTAPNPPSPQLPGFSTRINAPSVGSSPTASTTLITSPGRAPFASSSSGEAPSAGGSSPLVRNNGGTSAPSPSFHRLPGVPTQNNPPSVSSDPASFPVGITVTDHSASPSAGRTNPFPGNNDVITNAPSPPYHRLAGVPTRDNAPRTGKSPVVSPANITSTAGSSGGICQTMNGTYGSLDGRLVMPASLGYEIETIPVSDDELMNEIIPTLEHKMNDYLLPILFGNECKANNRRTLSAQTRRRLLQIIGISSQPADLMIKNSRCSHFTKGNVCHVFRAELTLYFADRRVLLVADDIVTQVETSLKTGLNDGAFDSFDWRIVRVSFVDFGQFNPSNPAGSQERPQNPQASTPSNSIWIGCVSAAGATVFVLVGAFAAYRYRQSMMHGSFVTLGSTSVAQDVGEVEETQSDDFIDRHTVHANDERQTEECRVVALATNPASCLYLEQKGDELVVKSSEESSAEAVVDVLSPSNSSIYKSDTENTEVQSGSPARTRS
jgi:hypothetical protein